MAIRACRYPAVRKLTGRRTDKEYVEDKEDCYQTSSTVRVHAPTPAQPHGHVLVCRSTDAGDCQLHVNIFKSGFSALQSYISAYQAN
ncbi:Hypothetical predicted protein [Xyrichtys novacula]|uniref:Uncharacterized protein n=1 Tax=Xyrichtys novacula TaxID=13765 RepID=A0AAV1FCS8_XYRNO|nr:Hypothetical predicted protein [Xyrichtys novacula]